MLEPAVPHRVAVAQINALQACEAAQMLEATAFQVPRIAESKAAQLGQGPQVL
jgi:hypothetical protein